MAEFTKKMLKRFIATNSPILRSSLRHFNENARFPYANRQNQQYNPQHQQPQPAADIEADGAEEAADNFSKARRPGLQSVPMNPPSVQTNAPTCIFPEEANQVYSIDDFPGLSVEPFSEDVTKILQAPLNHEDVEVKPDGAIYLPEVKYRKILATAFGAGGWALLPRGPHTLNGITLSREYALFCRGRFISQARGSANVQGQATAAASTESVRSNALMRCCKDLGIASELWDRYFVNEWKERYAVKKSIADRFGNSKLVWMKK